MSVINLDDFRKKEAAPSPWTGCTSLSAEYKEAMALTLTGWTLVGLGWWFATTHHGGPPCDDS